MAADAVAAYATHARDHLHGIGPPFACEPMEAPIAPT
jgi:hypothetical protein